MSLKSNYAQPACWDIKSEPFFRFTVKGKVRGWLYCDAHEATYDPDINVVVLQFVLGTVIVLGPKAGEFYEGFCAAKVTNLRANGEDILQVDLASRDTAAAQ